MSVSLFVPGWFSIALTMLSGFKRHGSSDPATAWWPSYATDFKPWPVGPITGGQGGSSRWARSTQRFVWQWTHDRLWVDVHLQANAGIPASGNCHTPSKNDTQNIRMKPPYPMTDLAYLLYLRDMYSSIFHKRGRETSINSSYLFRYSVLLFSS